MEALYFGHDALTRQSETLCRSKYASQTLTRAGRSPPKWINQTKEPRDPRAALAWKKHREASWNSSVRTYAPLCFRGLKPITMEPWACDAILYECDVDRIGGRQSQDIQAWMLQESLGYGGEWTHRPAAQLLGCHRLSIMRNAVLLARRYHAALRQDRLLKKSIGYSSMYEC